MANISSINGNPIVPSNGSVGTAQVASGYNLMTNAEKSKLSGVPAQGNTPFSSINSNPIVVGPSGIERGAVSKSKTDFAEAVPVSNLFDAERMAVELAWYYVQQSVGIISLTPTSVAGYWAIKIPVNDTEETIAYNVYSDILINYYLVDDYGNILARAGSNTGTISYNGTITNHTNAAYLLMTVRWTSDWNKQIMVCYGNSAGSYENYAEVIKIDGFEIAQKSDIDSLQSQIGRRVTKTKTDFIQGEAVSNLFDSKRMLTQLAWYYARESANVISLTPVSVAGYWAIKIPIDNRDSISYAINEDVLVNYYVTDEDGVILSRAGAALGTIGTSGTIESQTGAAYLLMTVRYGPSWNKRLMLRYGASAGSYEDYAETIIIDGFEIAQKQNVDAQVQHLQDQIDELNPDGVDLLMLPAKIDTVVNDSVEIFYKGLCNAVDTDKMEFDLSYSGAAINDSKGWARKFTATPTPADVGTHTLSIKALNAYGNQVDAKNVDIVVNPVPVSPASEQVILCMGDSLTTSGGWVKELRRRLIGSGGSPAALGLSNINFIGTQELADGTRYEGYGGWTFVSYSTANSSNAYMWITSEHDKTEASDQHSVYSDSNNATWKLETIESGRIKVIRASGSTALPSTGTLTWVSGGEHHSSIVYTASQQAAGNPFWNESEGKNDFVSYAARFGVNHIDHCVILLGWNNTGSTETYYKGITRTFLDSLLADFPNCKITLVGLQVPSRDGMAENYGIGWKFYDKLQHVWNLQKWYQELCDSEYPTADYVCLSAQFDTDYNCLTSQKDANLRNSTSVTVQSNAVHPAPSGYLQIADAVFRSIAGRL